MDKTMQYQDRVLAYRVEGSGAPLVLVHGFAEDGGIWDSQITFLRKKYRLIIPDLPGCGRSAALAGEISIEDAAEAVRAILDAENIRVSVGIGHSMGGYIVLALAEKYPERLKAAGLFHSTAYADSEEKKVMRRKCIEFIRKNGAAAFIRQTTPNLFAATTRAQEPELVEALIDRYLSFDPLSLTGYYEAMIRRPDRTGVLQQFEGPILFVIGEEDQAVPLAASLPQTYLPRLAHIHILKKAGHVGMLEDPARSNQILDSFLTNVYE
jgi:pimeloyl-ACP methyl ester carboxylesterase